MEMVEALSAPAFHLLIYTRLFMYRTIMQLGTHR